MWYYYFLANEKDQSLLQAIHPLEPTLQQKYHDQSIVKFEEYQCKFEKNLFEIPFVLSHDSSQHKEISSRNNSISQSLKNLDKKQKGKAVTLRVVNKQKSVKIKNTIKEDDSESGKGKNPGRNSTSNIFRVFLKLCLKTKLQKLIILKFNQLTNLHSLKISYEYFKIRLRQLSPSTSNYVNLREFKNIWEGENQFSKAFRCLFHWFVDHFAICHSISLKGKHKMMKESITHFLNNLHSIEQDLLLNEKEDIDENSEAGSKSDSTS